jgi:quinol monooxygenase YgiN
MLVVLARLFVKPERQADFARRAQPVIAATRAEQGNLSYTLYKSTESDQEFIYVETWASRADLERHSKSEHIRKFKRERADMMAGESVVMVYEVAAG